MNDTYFGHTGFNKLSFHNLDNGMEKQRLPGDRISDKIDLPFCFLGFFLFFSD